MPSLTLILLIFWICCAVVLAAFQLKYAALNRKYGSNLAPAGHPYGWFAVLLQGARYLSALMGVPADNVFSALSIIATVLWLVIAAFDLRKSQAAAARAVAPIVHEGIPAWGLALRGLNQIYIDLSGIDTKTLIESKIEIESLKAQITSKLQDAGIEIAATKASAKCWLAVQMKTQAGPKNNGSITMIYLQIGETLTNERLEAINVRANAPIFSSVTVAVSDGTPSADGLAATLDERLDLFLKDRNS